MNPLDELDFEYFMRMREAGDTLATWFFCARDFAALGEIPPEKVWTWVGSQYDAEDQASVGDEDVWGDPAHQDRLTLFAPVQLASRWSPLPHVGRRLGPPDLLRISQAFPTTALAAWKEPCPRAGASADRQEKFIDGLLQHAAGLGRPLALVTFPGFSFAKRELSPVAKDALRTAGFVFDVRSPL
jgi:hypothetical protein